MSPRCRGSADVPRGHGGRGELLPVHDTGLPPARGDQARDVPVPGHPDLAPQCPHHAAKHAGPPPPQEGGERSVLITPTCIQCAICSTFSPPSSSKSMLPKVMMSNCYLFSSPLRIFHIAKYIHITLSILSVPYNNPSLFQHSFILHAKYIYIDI